MVKTISCKLFRHSYCHKNNQSILLSAHAHICQSSAPPPHLSCVAHRQDAASSSFICCYSHSSIYCLTNQAKWQREDCSKWCRTFYKSCLLDRGEPVCLSLPDLPHPPRVQQAPHMPTKVPGRLRH